MSLLYQLMKSAASIFFNALNTLLADNLPPLSCACVIVEQQNRYLVIERSSGSIAFPGGFVRWREHPRQAACREGKEETGLQLRIGDMINCYSYTSDRFDHMSTTTLAYYAEVVGGELHSSMEGKPRWMSEDRLRTKLAHYHRDMLDDYLRYRSEHPAI
ncbi:MAG: NUDIX hydrolase [Ktedonobacteraceae bacterium]|nr:NUDIX hydrolase [Ktedonobacteraceae bacterium]